MPIEGRMMEPEQREPHPRYCAACGGLFADRLGDRCPGCGTTWVPRSFSNVATIATMLTELRWLREDGLIDQASYDAARSLYERRLQSVRGGVPAARVTEHAAGTTPAGATVPAGWALPWRAGETMAQPAVPRQSLGQWAAARQADILLYLGAFLLSIAALIFIGYQGEALSGVVRCLVLLTYTVAFLGLGVLLPRWDRVREAGPVFLVLGAVLVPANFIALRTQVLDPGDLPDDVLWLLGAGATGVLYILLAARGYGALYTIPGALALVVAYGALGSVLRLYPDWFGSWFGAGSAALAAATLRLPARRWAEAGALALSGFALLAAHAIALNGDATRWQLPLSYALVLAGAALLAYRGQVQALAALPALVAFLAMVAWWAGFGLDPPWWSVFLTGGGLGYLLLAEQDRVHRDVWRGAAAGAAVLAMTFAYGSEADAAATPWQIPATWLLILAGAAWEVYRGRVAGTLLLPAAGGLFGEGVLRTLDAPFVWSSYPMLGVAVVVALLEPWWSQRPPLERIGWPYTLTVALFVPVGFTVLYDANPAHGVAGFGVAAILFVVASLRSCGALARLGRGEPTARALAIERQSLARGGGVLLYLAAAYLNSALGVTGADRAWVYAGIGATAWVAAAIVGRRAELLGLFLPSGVAALALAAWLARDEPGRASLILTIGVVAPGWVYATTRRAALWLIIAAFVAARLAFDWRSRDFDPTLYPLACAATAAVLCAVLTLRRDYASSERGWTVALLSWAPWFYALAGAGVLLLIRADSLAAGQSPAETREWAVLTIVLAGAALAVTLEGLRLRLRVLAAFGSSALMLALLLGIAIARPENVQAYTLPAGLYLLALGFAWRRSPPLIDPHLDANEGLQLAGMLTIVLPAAQQAWQPGGGRFGLELIGVGLILLAAGLTVSARWLVVGGVLTLTGVALRWLLTESEIPYWLTLGVVGMALLILGTLLLLERERWDRLRERIKHWWTGAALTPDPSPVVTGEGSLNQP